MIPAGKQRGSGWWASNVTRRPVTVPGQDPVAQGLIGAIERAAARGMSGRSGHIAAGNGADGSYKFSGYLAYDVLAMTRTVGASTNRRGDPNVALPGTSGELVRVAAAGSVMDSLAAIPPGYR